MTLAEATKKNAASRLLAGGSAGIARDRLAVAP
jgi:hypothetical protein